jgi:hypothetical protein
MIALFVKQLANDPWFLLVGQAGIVLAAVVGAIALVSPKAFARLADVAGAWFDTSAAFARLDRPVYVDSTLVSYSRVFGAVVLAGAGVLTWMTPPAARWAPAAWGVAAGLAAVSVIAIACPGWFRRMAAVANIWIDTSRILSVLDYRVDIDSCVVRHCRVFGVCVLVGVGLISATFFF